MGEREASGAGSGGGFAPRKDAERIARLEEEMAELRRELRDI